MAAPGVQVRPSLAAVQATLQEVLRNAVEMGHSNSVLLVGPRGCGKTLVGGHKMRDPPMTPEQQHHW